MVEAGKSLEKYLKLHCLGVWRVPGDYWGGGPVAKGMKRRGKEKVPGQ